jgi:hypothetical protein
MTNNQHYTNGYTDYLNGLEPQSDNPSYLEGYKHQKYNTEGT